MMRGFSDLVARASRVLASASSRSRTFLAGSQTSSWIELKEKNVSARRRNQHAGHVRYPIQFAAP
ncbi:MAG: hypothetical protein DME60_06415 [Verrucomicrobia bacterium]|nr:MAG: hypothetical protein DME60_06415 [Verrucomicrobiota bacterium]